MSYPSEGTAEGLMNAVVDTPIYDRVLLRSLRRWTGLEKGSEMQLEFEDGNGMWITTGVSRDLSTT